MAIPKAHLDTNADPAGAGHGDVSPATIVTVAEDGGALSLPSASFITDGSFLRVGSDLQITDPNGGSVVARGYFAADPAPDFVSPDGALYLTPELVNSFLPPLAPGQYAQAAPVAAAAPIGQVLDLDGDAVAVRADGTQVQLGKGDPVFEGDVIQTGGGNSAIRMVFTDHTEFSLGTDARLALDQLVFNPDTQSGSAQFSVLKGVFIFASGQIAKTDNTDMTVTTPVATIGIRGTEVAGRVVDGDSQFTIIDGAIEVTTRAGSVTLDDRGETTQVAGSNTPPSDPIILTPAQFGQAYGDVAGVVSNYFNQAQPGAPGSVPGGDAAPSDSGGDQPNSSPSESDDRADTGIAPGGAMLASTLPSETPTLAGLSDPVALAAAFAADPVAAGPAASPFSVPAAGVAGVPDAGVGFFVDTGPSGGASGASSGTGEETVIAAVPGLGLAENITYGATGGATGFSPGFSGNAVGADSGDGAAGPVQVSFSPLSGVPGTSSSAIPGVDDVPSGSPPLDMPSTGSSGSPFRSESGASDAFAGNPYISLPFGYAGPQLGDAVFNLVAGSSTAPGAAGDIAGDDPNTAGIAPGPAEGAAASAPTPAPEPVPAEIHDITLIVSNATSNQQDQDLTHFSELRNEGAGSSIEIGGAEMNLPGVGASAQIALQRDDNGNVDVALTSIWDSVKNIRAESDTAGNIRIENFVHADIQFGDGGDSHITVLDAKRGNITTGNGNDSIVVEATSNGPGWSNHFNIDTGAGDDTVIFDGASNGLSELYFDGGAGTDTLRLTGPGQSFDLSSGQIQIAGVERIDISGAGNATLTVPENLFQGLNGSINPLTNTAQTLVVDGDSGDTLDLQGDQWHEVGTKNIDGHSYAIYQHGTDSMYVAADSDLKVA